MTPEDQAALEWQRQQMRRRSAQRGLQAKLRAPSGPAAQTKRNWAPLTRTGQIKGQA